jgi:membrane protein
MRMSPRPRIAGREKFAVRGRFADSEDWDHVSNPSTLNSDPDKGRRPPPTRRQQFWTLIKKAADEWSQDNIPQLSASLSFYAIFSIAPMLVLVLSVCGAMLGEEAVRGHLDNQIQSYVGAKTAAAVEEQVRSATTHSSGVMATIVGMVVLLVGATGFFGEVRSALNTIWGAPTMTRSQPWWEWVRSRLLSFGMVLAIMLLLMISLVFSTALSFAAKYMSSLFEMDPAFWGMSGFIVGLVIEVILFALIFRVLPDVHFPLRGVWCGATMTALMFECGKWSLAWYLGRESTASAYGAAGSLMVVLLWIYYSSIIVLTGAEFTQVYSRQMYVDQSSTESSRIS